MSALALAARPHAFTLPPAALKLVWQARERLLGRFTDASDARGTLNAVSADLREATGMELGQSARWQISTAIRELLQARLAEGRGEQERAASLETVAELRLAVVLLAEIEEGNFDG